MEMKHMDFLNAVAEEDINRIREKEKTYKGSWKKRGGIGAFMMLARKMDRLEQMAIRDNYDIFASITNDKNPGADGTVLAEIQDLRCYLLLVEAEYMARCAAMDEPIFKSFEDVPWRPGTPEDGGHHARFEDNEDLTPIRKINSGKGD